MDHDQDMHTQSICLCYQGMQIKETHLDTCAIKECYTCMCKDRYIVAPALRTTMLLCLAGEAAIPKAHEI
jgi:hypothetical protein